MPDEVLLDQLDRLTRRLQRNLECCDRALVLCCDLTVSQAYALLTLQEAGAITMNDFAAAMRLHGTTMTRMADALVEKGLVERQPAPGDRRIVRVALSARARQSPNVCSRASGSFCRRLLPVTPKVNKPRSWKC